MKAAVFFSLLSLAALLCDCAPKKHEQTTNTPSAHQTRFVTVADSVRLEVLDWGGTGKPLVFLTGFGNTAHVFDEFAPRFTNQYHVYAITRRGFGQSSIPRTGYDMATLAHDILLVLDSLRIPKALLAGHSIAGDEMSKFASTYPGRVSRIVYLDAAYDRSTIIKLYAAVPAPPNPTAKDSASRANYERYILETVGVAMPTEEITEINVFAKNGKFLREKAPAFVFAATVPKLARPDYRHIQSPALAIYAQHTTVRDNFPYYARLDSTDRKRAVVGFDVMQQWAQAQPPLFRQEVAHGTARIIKGGNHYLFISHPKETEQLMRKFLQ